ncbi:MAG: CoA pyrophosphatase [Aquisalimonadaceae bacterium]
MNHLVQCLAGHDCSEPVVQLDLEVDQWRAAAVLIALIPRREGYSVLLTRRSEHLREHAGQISFPGGRIDDGDVSAQAAALREAQEEVGLDPERVELVGAMAPYQTITGFIIYPFVGVVEDPGELRPEPGEVAEIFEVPLDFLMNPVNHRPHIVDRGGRQYRLHAMPYKDYYIWGVTAAILRQLYVILKNT